MSSPPSARPDFVQQECGRAGLAGWATTSRVPLTWCEVRFSAWKSSVYGASPAATARAATAKRGWVNTCTVRKVARAVRHPSSCASPRLDRVCLVGYLYASDLRRDGIEDDVKARKGRHDDLSVV